LAKEFPCPKCGTEIPVGQNFCTGCGERFEYKASGEGEPSEAPPTMSTMAGQPVWPPASPESHHRPTGFWAFLGTVGAILCLGAVFLLVVIGSGAGSKASGGGFSFKQLLPGPSLLPLIPKPVPEPEPEEILQQEKPDEVTGSSRYPKEMVIAVAKKVSPECRIQRVG